MLPKSLQCEEGEGEGAAVSVETAVTVEVAITVEPTITTPTVKIIQTLQTPILPLISHIKKDQSILTYLPVQAGPVHSTGKKAGEHPTALIPWSVSGSPSWPPEHEPLANSASRIVLKI